MAQGAWCVALKLILGAFWSTCLCTISGGKAFWCDGGTVYHCQSRLYHRIMATIRARKRPMGRSVTPSRSAARKLSSLPEAQSITRSQTISCSISCVHVHRRSLLHDPDHRCRHFGEGAGGNISSPVPGGAGPWPGRRAGAVVALDGLRLQAYPRSNLAAGRHTAAGGLLLEQHGQGAGRRHGAGADADAGEAAPALTQKASWSVLPATRLLRLAVSDQSFMPLRLSTRRVAAGDKLHSLRVMMPRVRSNPGSSR